MYTTKQGANTKTTHSGRRCRLLLHVRLRRWSKSRLFFSQGQVESSAEHLADDLMGEVEREQPPDEGAELVAQTPLGPNDALSAVRETAVPENLLLVEVARHGAEGADEEVSPRRQPVGRVDVMAHLDGGLLNRRRPRRHPGALRTKDRHGNEHLLRRRRCRRLDNCCSRECEPRLGID